MNEHKREQQHNLSTPKQLETCRKCESVAVSVGRSFVAFCLAFALEFAFAFAFEVCVCVCVRVCVCVCVVRGKVVLLQAAARSRG